mmetsp:Transcript_79633/g.200330  ORF Transcript_79633/g.200330 Transcript_79633/m.200330 type:complete len:136 (+) Transcript_79633:42-449(+)
MLPSISNGAVLLSVPFGDSYQPSPTKTRRKAHRARRPLGFFEVRVAATSTAAAPEAPAVTVPSRDGDPPVVGPRQLRSPAAGADSDNGDELAATPHRSVDRAGTTAGDETDMGSTLLGQRPATPPAPARKHAAAP